jgi:hypothetical protein
VIEVFVYALDLLLIAHLGSRSDSEISETMKPSYLCNLLVFFVTLLIGHATALVMTITGDWESNAYHHESGVDKAFAPAHIFNYGHLALGATSWICVSITEGYVGEVWTQLKSRQWIRYAIFFVFVWNYYIYDSKHPRFTDMFANLFVEYMMSGQLCYHLVKSLRVHTRARRALGIVNAGGTSVGDTDDVNPCVIALTLTAAIGAAAYKGVRMAQVLSTI